MNHSSNLPVANKVTPFQRASRFAMPTLQECVTCLVPHTERCISLYTVASSELESSNKWYARVGIDTDYNNRCFFYFTLFFFCATSLFRRNSHKCRRPCNDEISTNPMSPNNFNCGTSGEIAVITNASKKNGVCVCARLQRHMERKMERRRAIDRICITRKLRYVNNAGNILQ